MNRLDAYYAILIRPIDHDGPPFTGILITSSRKVLLIKLDEDLKISEIKNAEDVLSLDDESSNEEIIYTIKMNYAQLNKIWNLTERLFTMKLLGGFENPKRNLTHLYFRSSESKPFGQLNKRIKVETTTLEPTTKSTMTITTTTTNTSTTHKPSSQDQSTKINSTSNLTMFETTSISIVTSENFLIRQFKLLKKHGLALLIAIIGVLSAMFILMVVCLIRLSDRKELIKDKSTRFKSSKKRTAPCILEPNTIGSTRSKKSKGSKKSNKSMKPTKSKKSKKSKRSKSCEKKSVKRKRGLSKGFLKNKINTYLKKLDDAQKKLKDHSRSKIEMSTRPVRNAAGNNKRTTGEKYALTRAKSLNLVAKRAGKSAPMATKLFKLAKIKQQDDAGRKTLLRYTKKAFKSLKSSLKSSQRSSLRSQDLEENMKKYLFKRQPARNVTTNDDLRTLGAGRWTNGIQKKRAKLINEFHNRSPSIEESSFELKSKTLKDGKLSDF